MVDTIAVTVGSLNRAERGIQHLQSRARSERECRNAAYRFVVGQWITVGVDRTNHSAAAVVHYERPFTSRAVIEIAMRFEETGKLVENLDRKYVLGLGG